MERLDELAEAAEDWLKARKNSIECYDLKGDLQMQERYAARHLEDCLFEWLAIRARGQGGGDE